MSDMLSIRSVTRGRVSLALACAVAIPTFVIAASDVAVADEFGALRSSVREASAPASSPEAGTGEAPPPSSQPPTPSRADTDRRPAIRRADVSIDDGDGLSLGAVLGGAALAVVTSPFWAPPALLSDDYGEYGAFFSYPYKRGGDGTMVVEPDHNSFTKPWHVRVRGEFVDDFGALSRSGGHLLCDTTARFGFDSEINYRTQSLGSGTDDSLLTGDFNLLFRFAQTHTIQMRTGIGMNWLGDDQQNDFGFNFTYGGDWLPLKPWIVSSEIDWGRLGDAALFHGRVTLGVQYRHVELFTGYDHFEVGTANIDGLVAGVRLWF